MANQPANEKNWNDKNFQKQSDVSTERKSSDAGADKSGTRSQDELDSAGQSQKKNPRVP